MTPLDQAKQDIEYLLDFIYWLHEHSAVYVENSDQLNIERIHRDWVLRKMEIKEDA